MTTYTVKAGDTLDLIAEHQLGNVSAWQEIAQLNHIAAPYTIYVGQSLELPNMLHPIMASAPATSAPGAAPADSAKPGALARLTSWARANPGQALFYAASIAATLYGLYFMASERGWIGHRGDA